MSLKNRTKLLLAGCMEDILKTRDFESIKISDLCKKCDINRQTFYYHFKDKYDLAAWIFLEDMENINKSSEETFLKSLISALKLIYKKRHFYLKILDNFKNNYVKIYIHNYNISNNEELIKKYYGLNTINNEMRLALSFYSYGSINTTFDWLSFNYNMTAEELASYQYHMMPDFLREAFCS